MKKVLAIMLLSALIFTACGETNLDTSSDISSQTVLQTVSEDTSSDISSETASNTISEEEQDQLYIQKAKESLAVENPQEIIDALKAKDEEFETALKNRNIAFNFEKHPLIQEHEYTLEEYAKTGKIEPRAINEYIYDNSYYIRELEKSVGLQVASFIIPFEEMIPTLKNLKINPETMKVCFLRMKDLGAYYYVDDGEKQVLLTAFDNDGGYERVDSEMLLLYDTTDGKPYNCIILNENTQLRAKGVVADTKEYSEILKGYDKINLPLGGKAWTDKKIITEYFVEACNMPEDKYYGELIDPKHMQYFGESNGWRIYHVVYVGQIYDAVYAEMDLGGYKFKYNGILSPSASGVYAIKRKEVLTLKEAYEKGEIDIKEVYDFTPDEYKAD